MKKQTVPFGDVMGMEVALSNTISVDMTDSARMVWVSGQVAFDEHGEIVGKGNIRIQTEQSIKNIASALKEVGGTLDDVVNLTVFVKEMDDLSEINKMRLKYFNKPYPTSTTVQISDFVLPDILIEIDAQAVISIK